MNHPVKECISMLGVSQVLFAVLHVLSFQRLKACLYEHTPVIPLRIVNALVQHGYDEQEAQKQYTTIEKVESGAGTPRRSPQGGR
ncbi:preprotein translocase subunit TatA [Brevibacillus ruminantium]|uniref:Preprotein translocase subunit TatA n=1 Tax=Brevibacillus ruminantium TaxID=2950604 RepID=A0ABY4WD02_9BACL|nr:preprotein translocase subunit TatA [Brevibacillus ruminantium]USG64634.1 preprotein translocase subunit TatA [Brevibacillus ruminantium]